MDVTREETQHTIIFVCSNCSCPKWSLGAKRTQWEKCACLQLLYIYWKNGFRQLYYNCIYLFTTFYLKLTFITACLLKQKESEQNAECGSDYSNLFLCLKNSNYPLNLFVVVFFSFFLLFFSCMFMIMCKKKTVKKLLCYIKKESTIPRWSFQHCIIHL